MTSRQEAVVRWLSLLPAGAGARRWLTVLLAGVGLLAVTVGPAAADPAGPTHYHSELTGIAGQAEGIQAEVFGGDSFLVLTVEPGREVVVPGYEEPELYLRFASDGDVYVNTRGRTHYQNQDRYQNVVVPPDASPDAPPQWELVATGGTYAWHDHRIHWMSPTTPPQIDPNLGEPQEVWPWPPVPLQVDGELVVLEGTLTWLPGPSPVVPAVLAVVAFAVVAAVSLRWPLVGAAAALAVAGVGALAIGTTAWLGVPPGADPQAFLVLLPVVALIVIAVGTAVARRRPGRGRLLVALGGVPLVAWALTQVGALTRPLLPVGAPEPLVRAAVAIAFGVGAATIVAALVAAWRTPAAVAEPA